MTAGSPGLENCRQLSVWLPNRRFAPLNVANFAAVHESAYDAVDGSSTGR